MSTFISGVANPMTEALYKPPPIKPHTRRPPKTPHSMIRGDHLPPLPKGMTKEELEEYIEKKRAEWGQKINSFALGSKPMRQPPIKGTKNTGAEASAN